MAEIQDLEIIDASNTDRFPEGMRVNAVNNQARALEGMLARGLKDVIDGSVTTSGTTTAYTVASNRTLSAYYDGMTITVKWNATCGATPTVNVDSIGAKNLYWPGGNQVTTGDLLINARSIIQYDGTKFQVLTGSTIDTDNALSVHIADTSTHGITSNIVGETESQTLTNKTIVAASNTITTAATGNLTSTNLNAALAELQTDVDTKTTLAAATAATAADVVLTNADVVSTNQDTIDTAADLVLTNADVVLTHADEVLTRADTVLTAADVVSTAADAASASASAATASAAASGIYWKEPVVNRSTANLTLSGEQTIDGILTSTSRILVMNQSSAAENGIYVTASGAWARAVPLNTWDEHVGATVVVSQGSAYQDTSWMCTVDPGGTLGSTAITWASLGVAAVNFSTDNFETSTDYTAGTTTTLVITTNAGSEQNIQVFFDGLHQHKSTYTYTAGTRTITFDAAIPVGTEEVEVTYGSTLGVGTPADGAVGATQLASNAVETAKIADNAVTLAKMASGTDGNIISFDASGNPVAIATGTDGQVLTSAGAGAQPAFEDAGGGFTLGTPVASASQSDVTFGSIPSGTTQIIITLHEVSLAATQHVRVQLGDGGGIETGSYISEATTIIGDNSQTVNNTATSFVFMANYANAGDAFSGSMILTLANASTNRWVYQSVSGSQNFAVTVAAGAGTKALSAEITQVKILAGASSTFDVGTLNIAYQ